MADLQSLSQLMDTMPQIGVLKWIGIRPARKELMLEPSSALLDIINGLEGDRYKSTSGKRQVTLLQYEHLPAIASMLHMSTIDPATLRRNLCVAGLNLLALKNKQFSVGNTILEYTGQCHPCSRMEALFGPGGYNAVRGHGGITAKVIVGGEICLGDSVSATSAGE